MVKKRYYFPYIAKGQPLFHIAVTSKTLLERLDEVTEVFEKYSQNSDPQSPKQIIYLLTEINGSLFQLNECGNTPETDSNSSKIKSSPESSSPDRSNLRLKHLPSVAMSTDLETRSLPNQPKTLASPKKKVSSTVSKAAEIVPSSHIQFQESTSCQEEAMITSSLAAAVKNIESPIKTPRKNVDPTSKTQESVSPSAKAIVAEKSHSEVAAEDLKIPASAVKDVQKVSKPAKRPKLCDNLADIPEYVSPRKKAKTIFQSPEDDKMDISPRKADNMMASTSKDIPVFSDKNKSEKNEPLGSSLQVLKDEGIDLDISITSEENLVSTCTVSSEEIKNLVDDPSQVECIRKAVEDRMKVSFSPKKTKGNLNPSEKKNSNSSPMKLRKRRSPGKDVKNGPDTEVKSQSLLPHPNVMVYLKLRFKSILSHRKKCMLQIYGYFNEFVGDVNFLYFYASSIFEAVQDIPIEGKAYFSKDLKNLKNQIIRNATELRISLRSLTEKVKLDISFWDKSLDKIRKLNIKNEPFLSSDSCSLKTIKFLQEYESNLRKIWKRMDNRVLISDGLRRSLLEISADFIKLTKDFAQYLLTVELMKPSSLASTEGEKRRLHISWH